jgi:ABC-type proline/glycine betaine transport system ATPase subunit
MNPFGCSKDTTLKMIREATPGYEGLVEIKSRYGTKRITSHGWSR